MGLLSKIVGGGVAEPIEALGNAFDKIFTSDEERMEAQSVLDKIAMQPSVLQGEISKLEAQHRSPFVAGARPFILWICGFALAWHFIGYDMVNWLSAIWFPDIVPPKLAGTDSLITVMMSLLGLGTLRTAEKMSGRAK